MNEVTQWFEPTEKPVRTGVYEFEHLPNPYHYWDGRRWRGAGSRPEHLAKSPDTCCVVNYVNDYRWRGLANPPEQSK